MEDIIVYKRTVNIKGLQKVTMEAAVKELSVNYNKPDAIKRSLLEGCRMATAASLYAVNKELIEE